MSYYRYARTPTEFPTRILPGEYPQSRSVSDDEVVLASTAVSDAFGHVMRQLHGKKPRLEILKAIGTLDRAVKRLRETVNTWDHPF